MILVIFIFMKGNQLYLLILSIKEKVIRDRHGDGSGGHLGSNKTLVVVE